MAIKINSLPPALKPTAEKLDRNRDGQVSANELAKGRQQVPQGEDPARWRSDLDAFARQIGQAPVALGSSGEAAPLPLVHGGSSRPVFLAADGSFLASPEVRGPLTPVQTADGLYRAASLVDDQKENPLAGLPLAAREKILSQLLLSSKLAPAAGPFADGLAEKQGNQLRSSAATVLLALLESSPEPQLAAAALAAYETLVVSETIPRLRESMIFNLHLSPAAAKAEVRAVSERLMRELAPLSLPYDVWFANGNKTVNLEWVVGPGQFWKGFVRDLKALGFQPLGAENQSGVSTYEVTLKRQKTGETTFRISVREGGTEMLAKVGDPNVHVLGYEGHSNWGRTMNAAVRSAPRPANGGEGQLFISHLCVGKTGLDAVREAFPNLQAVTTFASGAFRVDENGVMNESEGIQALATLIYEIADRSDWAKLHRNLNLSADLNSERTWENYVTPHSHLARAKVLDRDHDGQADYLDKLYDFNTVAVAEDTAREFTPLQASRPAGVLEGTKVLVAANMINAVSEFSGVLEKVNLDSKVVPAGWFEPAEGETAIVRFEKVVPPQGATEYRMQANARYAHMSEEALRLASMVEFNRLLVASGALPLDAVDAKLNGLMLAAHSLQIDEGSRDGEIWKQFLKAYGFPDVDRFVVAQGLTKDPHSYAGSAQGIEHLKGVLPAQVLGALA